MPAHDADLNELLLSFLGGDRAAQTAFPMAAMPYLTAGARRLTFNREQVLEIVDEVFVALARCVAGDFDPLRGDAGGFLQGLLKNAARKVRSSYRPAGQRSRASRGEEVPADSGALDLAEGLPAKDVNIIASVDARAVLGRMEPDWALAYVRVHVVGETMVEVARASGVSRFKLARAFAMVESAERKAA